MSGIAGIIDLTGNRSLADPVVDAMAAAIAHRGPDEARPDLRGLDQAFTFFSMPGPRTAFEGIQLLPPGHYLRVRQGKPVEERVFWRMDPMCVAGPAGCKPVVNCGAAEVLDTYPRLVRAAESPVIDTSGAASRDMRPGSSRPTALATGLVAVISTQLWHPLFIDDTLADLPGCKPAARPAGAVA